MVREALRDRQAILRMVAADGLADGLADAYRASYRWQARREARDRRIEETIGWLLGALFYGLSAVLAALLYSRASNWSALAYFGGWFAGIPAVYGLISIPRLLSVRSLLMGQFAVIAGMLGGAYLLWQGVGTVTGLLDRIAADFWLTALVGAAVAPVLCLAFAVPTMFVAAWLQDRYATRTESRTALLAQLFALLLTLVQPRALADEQVTLLRKLDQAASVLEEGLWREVQLTDPLSRAIWRDRCRQCAQHLRSFDLSVVLPRRDTREYLLAETNALIHVLVRGCLDELPTAAPRPRRGLAVVGDAARNLLLGLIPLAAVLGAKFAGLNLSGAMGGALVVAAIVWFVLTVLTTLDGQAATRLSLLKDAAETMGSFRGGRT